MNKQIEEMAFDLCRIDTCKHLKQEECNKTTCAHCEAEALYTAGYRKQGEARWKGAGMGDYSCSLCNATYSGGNEYNFCPNCGRRMRGGDKE